MEETWFKSNHPYLCLLWLSWKVIFQAIVGCHGILILGKSLIKWRQRPDMTLAVDLDVKHQTNKTSNVFISIVLSAFALLQGLNIQVSFETKDTQVEPDRADRHNNTPCSSFAYPVFVRHS